MPRFVGARSRIRIARVQAQEHLEERLRGRKVSGQGDLRPGRKGVLPGKIRGALPGGGPPLILSFQGFPEDRLEIINAAWRKGHAAPEVKEVLGKLMLWAPFTSGAEIKDTYPKKIAVWKRLLEPPGASRTK